VTRFQIIQQIVDLTPAGELHELIPQLPIEWQDALLERRGARLDAGKPMCIIYHGDRDDGPSSIWEDGSYTWRNRNGDLHRVGGPAVFDVTNGLRIWFENGIQIKKERF